MPTNHCSPRARGANALLSGKFEPTYGVVPGGNYFRLPFLSGSLGETQALIEDETLGTGREGLDPVLDVIDNDGDLTVPVDVRLFGHWLTMMMGKPAASPAAVSAASLNVTFLAQPAANATITINGTTFTAKASGATGNQFNIGASIADTVTALAAVLNASVVAGVAVATYTANGVVLGITHDTTGLTGNSFTVAGSVDLNAKIPAGTLQGGTVKHVYTSGGLCLPSMSLEFGHPEIPAYDMNYGVLCNTLRIAMQRGGLLNAQLGLIAKGTNAPKGTSDAGTVVETAVLRFPQARGEVVKDGVTLASLVGGNIGLSNNLEKLGSITPDGRIEGADPGMFTCTGESTVIWRDLIMDAAATAGEPVSLVYKWAVGNFVLKMIVARAFLPKPKKSISGPGGIQRTYNWQASGEGVDKLVVELTNDVGNYDV